MGGVDDYWIFGWNVCEFMCVECCFVVVCEYGVYKIVVGFVF